MNSNSNPEAPAPGTPRRKFNASIVVALLSLGVIFLGARYAVTHFRRPGSMSVIEAQAMDMSVMKPPVGAVPVEVATVSRGILNGGTSYTGSVLAFNDAQIAARVTGRIIEMPVYPGARVRRGQLLVRLDSEELRAKENTARFAREAASQDRLIAGDEADAALAAQSGARAEAARTQGQTQENAATIGGAEAAVRVAESEVEAARQGVSSAQSDVEAARADKRMAQANVTETGAGLSDARGEVEAARAAAQQARERLPQVQSDVEAARADVRFAQNKRDRSAELLKQGAISREEFQSDDAALQNANAKLDSALAKVRETQADIAGADANVRRAQAGTRAASAKVSGSRAAVAKADAAINSALQKLAQSRVAVESAEANAVQSRAEVGAARARLAQAQAGIGAAQAAQQSARANARKANNQAGRAQVLVAQAQAQLSEAQIVRGYTEIRAPNDGVVSKRLVAPGSLVDAGTPILQITQLSPIRFQASVAQSDLSSVRVGTPVSIRSATGQTLQTQISAVFPSADAQSRTGTIEAVAPNDDGRFKPGEYITMQLATSQTTGALRVPSDSLVMQSQSAGGAQVVALRETASVWVMERATSGKAPVYTCTMHPQIREEKPGDCPICGMKLTPLEAGGSFRARLVPVKIGASNGDFAEVLGGLQEGQKVLTRGFDDLKDGDAVVPTRFDANGPLDLPSVDTGDNKMAAMPGMATSGGATTSPPDAMAGMKMSGNPAPSTSQPDAMSGMKMSGAPAPSKPKVIRVSVDGSGFSPSNFDLQKGVSTTITFVRTTDATCATSVVWPDFQINKKLPLNQPVSFSITPRKSGTSGFACGMNMLKGSVIVR